MAGAWCPTVGAVLPRTLGCVLQRCLSSRIFSLQLLVGPGSPSSAAAAATSALAETLLGVRETFPKRHAAASKHYPGSLSTRTSTSARSGHLATTLHRSAQRRGRKGPFRKSVCRTAAGRGAVGAYRRARGGCKDLLAPVATQSVCQLRATVECLSLARASVRLAYRQKRSLTPRSSRAPTAGHQAPATGTVYIFCARGLASHRWCRLTSNVRRRKSHLPHLSSASKADSCNEASGCTPGRSPPATASCTTSAAPATALRATLPRPSIASVHTSMRGQMRKRTL